MCLMTACTKVVNKEDAGRGIDAQFRILGKGLPVVLPDLNPEGIVTASDTNIKVS